VVSFFLPITGEKSFKSLSVDKTINVISPIIFLSRIRADYCIIAELVCPSILEMFSIDALLERVTVVAKASIVKQYNIKITLTSPNRLTVNSLVQIQLISWSVRKSLFTSVWHAHLSRRNSVYIT